MHTANSTLVYTATGFGAGIATLRSWRLRITKLSACIVLDGKTNVHLNNELAIT